MGAQQVYPQEGAVCDEMQTRIILPTNIAKKQHIAASNTSQLQYYDAKDLKTLQKTSLGSEIW